MGLDAQYWGWSFWAVETGETLEGLNVATSWTLCDRLLFVAVTFVGCFGLVFRQWKETARLSNHNKPRRDVLVGHQPVPATPLAPRRKQREAAAALREMTGGVKP